MKWTPEARPFGWLSECMAICASSFAITLQLTAYTHTKRRKEAIMGNRDKVSNKVQDLKGKGKEAVGSATGNHELEARGKADQAKAGLKDAGEKVKDAASDAKDAVTGR